MVNTCPECGAPLRTGQSCRDLFHEILLLEWEIPGGPGAVSHFYAVAAYALQHPESMNYTAEALAGLREALADHLTGRAGLEQIRRRVRHSSDGAKRVTRRQGDAALCWPVESWPMTASDVHAGGVEGYSGRVTAWARSTIETLEAAIARHPLSR